MKYKHALFLNPYTTTKSSVATMTGLFPPTGLEYVATSAKGLVDKLTLLDLRHEKVLCDADKLSDFIRKEKIDIICATISWNRQVDEICRLLNRTPDGVTLVVGGYRATEIVEELFRFCPKIDIIVRGEGDETTKEIFKGANPENILGISYRKDKKIIHNQNRPLPDINTVEPPDRSLRRYEYRMMLYGMNVMNVTYDTILSARGCPYNCKFCTFSLNPLGQKRTYMARTAGSVMKEIEGITADMILFCDDNFATEPKRAEEICDLVISRKIKKRFIAQVRIEIAKHPELLEKMTKAGFKVVFVGIESPHDRILREFNKGFDAATIRKCFKVLRKYPIFYHGTFIYGNIGETEEEMLYIAKFAKEIGLDSIAYSKLRINKFSPLKKVVEETPGYHIDSTGELYSDKYSPAAMKRIKNRIQFSFYTPLKLFRIVRRILVVRFFTPREIISFIITGPVLLTSIIVREIRMERFSKSIRNIFGPNKSVR